MTNLTIFLLGLASLNIGLWLVHPSYAFTVTGTILLCVWACTVGLSLMFPAQNSKEGK